MQQTHLTQAAFAYYQMRLWQQQFFLSLSELNRQNLPGQETIPTVLRANERSQPSLLRANEIAVKIEAETPPQQQIQVTGEILPPAENHPSRGTRDIPLLSSSKPIQKIKHTRDDGFRSPLSKKPREQRPTLKPTPFRKTTVGISAKTILKNHIRHCNRLITNSKSKELVKLFAHMFRTTMSEVVRFVKSLKRTLTRFDFDTIRKVWSGEGSEIRKLGLTYDNSFSHLSDDTLDKVARCYRSLVKVYFKRLAVHACYHPRIKMGGVGMLAAINHILQSLDSQKKCELTYHKLLITPGVFQTKPKAEKSDGKARREEEATEEGKSMEESKSPEDFDGLKQQIERTMELEEHTTKITVC